ncbi:hypothetical protein ACFWG5_18530 [Streptomyces hydrogenans]|uniref:hypothetical protein n=1 Tax=Streptomyces hydrogenans TaxID=1873719 RepID=UPI00364B8EFB
MERLSWPVTSWQLIMQPLLGKSVMAREGEFFGDELALLEAGVELPDHAVPPARRR